MTKLRPTGRTPHQVAEIRPTQCPRCEHPWPRRVAGRVLLGVHKCITHRAGHRTYTCRKCDHVDYDPPLDEGCSKWPPSMGTPEGGWMR